ncbi:hypothetical protein C3942_00750 [Solimonas fluminis]|uniref:Uncharacterized protein n=1 Tax=Solimonas fluminis TaxID=2086571 RepID=A0A2S5TKH0_9GAMM|nr:Cro/CI family transcriptional regulator [Solimonas fluminis]PPE75457.1 hypothetical protein C3942_00750 [Solimonas fluminis]
MFILWLMSALLRAIDMVGTQAKMAEDLGVSPMAVSNWVKRGVPPRRAPQIEALVQGRVTCAELCPEVFARVLRPSIGQGIEGQGLDQNPAHATPAPSAEQRAA